MSESTSEKDLGVTFDKQMDFTKHINKKINMANKMSGVIRRNYKFLNKDNFPSLYKALVRSQFDYCAPIWTPFKRSQIGSIEKVQRRATKQIPRLKM